MADILEIKNLNKKFGGVIATKDLNLSILEGELHAIIGPNGAGKTTLISQIFGQIFPDSGQIFFQDTNVTKVSEYKRSRLGINRTFQITSVMKSLTVSENIQLATDTTRENSFNFFKASNNQTTIFKKIDFCLRQVGLIEVINQPVASLSHGDCRKLEIAMALASDAQLLLLDEPMAGLGPTETKEMIALLEKMLSPVPSKRPFVHEIYDLPEFKTLCEKAGITPSDYEQEWAKKHPKLYQKLNSKVPVKQEKKDPS